MQARLRVNVPRIPRQAEAAGRTRASAQRLPRAVQSPGHRPRLSPAGEKWNLREYRMYLSRRNLARYGAQACAVVAYTPEYMPRRRQREPRVYKRETVGITPPVLFRGCESRQR